MKIVTHPRMHTIDVGDEVYSHTVGLFAPVIAVFPAAVCVRVVALERQHNLTMLDTPQLWGADDIENLSVCRHCGSRTDLHIEHDTGVPYRVCDYCAAAVPAERPRPDQHADGTS